MRDAVAKGFRTFLAGAAAALTAAATVTFFSDTKVGATILAISLVASVIAGVVSFAQAAAGSTADTPVGRAFRTFYQLLAGGLGTVAVVSLATNDLLDVGTAILKVVGIAVLAGLGTLALNYSEAT
jgi:hypothetical protein